MKRIGSNRIYVLSGSEVKKIEKLLLEQWTLKSIYSRYFKGQDVSFQTWRKAVKEEGLDPSALRAAGIASLRAKAFQLIGAMPDEEAEFKAAMKFLEKYDKQPSEEEPEQVETVSDNEIRMKILEELGKR